MTSETVILPAINRGCPGSISLSSSGIFSYACRYNIYFADFKSTPPLLLDSKYLHEAHHGKIISLSFCKYEGPELLASCSEDGELKIWDVDTSSCIMKATVKDFRTIEWIHDNPNVLVHSIDQGKYIMKWNIKLNTFTKIKSGSDLSITVLLSNKCNPEILAVGHNNGIISIINVTQEKLICVLKAHSMEITTLSWNSNSCNTLLSASLDNTLRVWKIDESTPIFTYYSPTSRNYNDDKKNQKMLAIFHPTEQNIIICSNTRGEVGEIVIKEKPKFVAYAGKSSDVNLKYPITLILDPVDGILYCFDSFKVSKYSINKQEFITQYPFLLGFVYDLLLSKVNPNLLAACCSDGILKIWDSGSMNVLSIFIHSKIKIMTAAWHPRYENILAYGTNEGRVGIADTFKKRSIYSFETHHKDTVYSLSWGTCSKAPKEEGEGDGKYFLYSCGGGSIYINKEGCAKNKALNFDDLVVKPDEFYDAKQSYSEVRWNSSYTFLCVGSYKGFVELFNGELDFIGRLIVPIKSVESLCWHPEVTYMSPSGSPLKSWLACSGSDAEIYIFDTSEISGNSPDVYMCRPIRKLVGHKKRTVSVCWSEHSDGFLVSASKDGSVLVWNVSSGTAIASYLSHFDSLNCVQWSTTDKDMIYSGGQDGSVRGWRVSQQNMKPPPEKAPSRKRIKKMKVEDSTPSVNVMLENNENVPVTVSMNNETQLNNDSIDIISCNKEVKVSVKIEETCDDKEMKNNKPVKRTNKIIGSNSKTKSLFPMYNFTEGSLDKDSLEDCMKLADFLTKKQNLVSLNANVDFESMKENCLSDADVLKFGLFYDQQTALRMLDVQGNKFKLEENNSAAFEVNIMSGNVQQVLHEAAEKRILSPSLVSLAPSVSHKFWLEMCDKYASQLVECRQYSRACTYYLMCGKIHEAVNLLADKGNIADAIALAKARLPETDPVISYLLLMFRKRYAAVKNYAMEAQCSIARSDPLRAAKVLASSGDPSAARTAAYICRKFNLIKEADEYLFLCLEQCLIKCDWKSFKLMVTQEPFLQVYEVLVCVHEAFYQHFRQLKPKDNTHLRTVFSFCNSTSELKIWCGSICKDDNQSFIHYVYELLLSKGLLPDAKDSLYGLYKALKTLEDKRKSLELSSEAHVSIAIYITEYILQSLLKDESANQSFLKIFEASYDIVFLPKIICALFLPFDLIWCSSTRAFKYEVLLTDEITVGSENDLLSNFSVMYHSLGEKIVNVKFNSLDVPLIEEENLKSNLSGISNKIKYILSFKNTEDFLLAYFVAAIINDLTKIKGKNLAFQCSTKHLLTDIKENISNEPRNAASTNIIEIEQTPNLEYSKMNSAINIENILLQAVDIINVSDGDGNAISAKVTEIEPTEKYNDVVDINEQNIIPTKSKTVANVTAIDAVISSPINIENELLQSCSDVTNTIEKDVTFIEVTGTKTSKEELVKEYSNDINLENVEDIVDQADKPRTKSVSDILINSRNKSPGFLQENENYVKEITNNEETLTNNLNDVNLGDNINSKALYEDEQIRKLIESVIKEADQKAQSIIQSETLKKEEIHDTKFELKADNISIHSTMETQHYQISDKRDSDGKDNVVPREKMNHKIDGYHERYSDGIIVNYPEELQLNSELEENMHEKCLKQIDLFYSVILLVISSTCKDEYALLFYLKERLNVLNNNISILNKIADETSRKFKNKNKMHIDNSLEENTNKQETAKVDSNNCLEQDCLSINNISKSINSELTTSETDYSNTISSHTLEYETYCDSDKISNTVNTIGSSKTHCLQTLECDISIDNIHSCNDENKIIFANPENDYTLAIPPNSTSYDISEKCAEIQIKHVHDTKNLQEEHKLIMEILHDMEDSKEVKGICYPNPFHMASKLNQIIYDVMHKSNCHVIQNKLHNLLHDVINWSKKFNIGEINFVCQVCSSV